MKIIPTCWGVKLNSKHWFLLLPSESQHLRAELLRYFPQERESLQRQVMKTAGDSQGKNQAGKTVRLAGITSGCWNGMTWAGNVYGVIVLPKKRRSVGRIASMTNRMILILHEDMVGVESGIQHTVLDNTRYLKMFRLMQYIAEQQQTRVRCMTMCFQKNNNCPLA